MRWIVRIIVALVIVGVAAVAVLFLLPADKIAKLVSDQFEAVTGRAMTLEGDVRPSLWPELGVNIDAVTVANASWSSNGPMIKAESLSVGIDVMALFGGAINIKRIEVTKPEILLEIASDGSGNWEIGTEAGDKATDETASTTDNSSPKLPDLILDGATVVGGRLTFVDHSSGTRTELTQIDASMELPDLAGLAKLRGSAAMNGQGFSFSTQITGFADFLTNGAVPVVGKANVGNSTASFNGRAGLSPLAAGGQVDVDLSDMASLFRLVGAATPKIPKGLGQVVKVSADMTLDDAGAVTLRNANIALDQNRFTGAVDATISGRPKIVAQLSAGALDFSSLMAGVSSPGSGGDAVAATPSTGWSKKSYDISAMQIVDAEVSLAADSIDLGITKLGRARTFTNLDTGRAVIELKDLAAYGGAMAGTWILNSRGGLSTRVTLTGTNVALQPLLTDLAGYDRLIASGNVSMNILGVGNNLYTLMNSLSGTASTSLGQGELRGLDLAGMLRTLDTSYVGDGAKTIFKSVTASFNLDGGVARNSDLQLEAPLITATGSGEIGIGSKTLNYRVTSVFMDSDTSGGVKIPLVISGAWSDPKFGLDLEALAQQELSDEVEEVKTQVEDVVKEKLESELGVKVEDLSDIDNVLKEELQERALDGVLNLLNGN